MKCVKVCYSTTRNLGDMINPLIIENILGYKVICANWYKCQTSGIGSGLYRYFDKKPIHLTKSLKLIKGYTSQPLQIWSAGFIMKQKDELFNMRRTVNVSSVRGEESKKILEKIMCRKLNCTTGDAGLLAAELLKKPRRKKYKLGIIPHISEKDDDFIKHILNNNTKSIKIDVTAPPLDSLEAMYQCDCIISSSLHGLIIADSMRIPNKQFTLNNKLYGDGFKFYDYYSAFGIPVNSFDLKDNYIINIEKIISEYKITDNQIERKKFEIIKSFSRFLV